jgi:hypothetical protein
MLHKQPILLLTLELSRYMLQILLWAFSTVGVTSQTNAGESFLSSAVTSQGTDFVEKSVQKEL